MVDTGLSLPVATEAGDYLHDLKPEALAGGQAPSAEVSHDLQTLPIPSAEFIYENQALIIFQPPPPLLLCSESPSKLFHAASVVLHQGPVGGMRRAYLNVSRSLVNRGGLSCPTHTIWYQMFQIHALHSGLSLVDIHNIFIST